MTTVNNSPFFFTDFENGLPAEFSGAGNLESVQGYEGIGGFSGNFLRNTTVEPAQKTTLTLTDLPEHNAIDLGFFAAIINSWDGADSLAGPDIFNVTIDGQNIFSESETVSDSFPSFEGFLITEGSDLGFPSSPPYRDKGYNFRVYPTFRNIPHNSDTLTVEWFASGSGWQGGDDESWAIDNVEVTLKNNEYQEATVDLKLLDANGNEITNNTILGDTFFLEVLVEDPRETDATGLMAFTYNLDFPADVVQNSNDFSEPNTNDNLIPANFPLLGTGTLDNTNGEIIDLGAGSLPKNANPDDTGTVIGEEGLETFSTLSFNVEDTRDDSTITLTVDPSQTGFADGKYADPNAQLEFTQDLIINDAPVVDTIADVSIPEDVTATSEVISATAIVATDDGLGNALTFTLTSPDDGNGNVLFSFFDATQTGDNRFVETSPADENNPSQSALPVVVTPTGESVIDFESGVTSYEVSVVASDGFKSSAVGETVNVDITDVADPTIAVSDTRLTFGTVLSHQENNNISNDPIWGIKAKYDHVPPTSLFSFRQNGTNFQNFGALKLNGSNILVDGLAISPSEQLFGFHQTDSGSRLVAINPNNATVTPIGSRLANRVISGAVFQGEKLWVIDNANDELLQVNPETGEIIGAPQTLTQNGIRFNFGSHNDLAVDSNNHFYLASNNGVYALDIKTGELSFVGFDDFNPEGAPSNFVPGGLPYLYGGITFADSSNEENLFLIDAHWYEDILKGNIDTFSNSILFSDIISSYNSGPTDLAAQVTIPTSDLVRPAFPDTTQFFDITNTGTGALDILNISSIDVNHSSVSLDPESVAGDIILNPGESHRVFLTYAPEAAGEDFDLADALVIHSNAVNDSSFDVALAGKSTYDSDISYDGTVNLEDLAVLEQLTFPSVEGDGNYHGSADVNGDGKINRGELIPLNFELFETIL
ncbi:UNVERIFIED_CONTAM: hypothetical protein BEN50_01995 [Euhalothece sp. KZN 001]